MNEAIECLRALVEHFRDELLSQWGENLVSVVLYGSVARGDGDRSSDVDLLVIAEELPYPRFARHELLEPIREALRDEMDALYRQGYNAYLSLVIKNRAEAVYHSPLYLDMTEDAVLLYDKGDFFRGVLDEMRARMEELGSQRVWLEDGWYWDLKPDYQYPEVFEI